ncbi:ornithine carbamoyltransferase [Rhizopus microsporus var. microsporus]|uniref:ornithine carbamoyltransferase n=2 Tax=Rhizopus microsporus TaxID=58291 RepID=A0A2G4T3V2_RHIZD|nr:ornithine carbamoyltransferase [Rhizopus microsporus ATCC 52813]ORE06691.1 ornithine carbamoyltransferase [Rhizopus microsporus var. microsporus]PHZ15703.1 ornithine carbamoyltransferase [Rhizopus microsporus ATCC 52813]
MTAFSLKPQKPNHFITTADYTADQLLDLVYRAIQFKVQAKTCPKNAERPLAGKTVALIFSKRSTRTRVATETAVNYLGGNPMFLGSQDIQLGVNESLFDTARVVSSMVDGIMARVGDHSEIETLAKESSVPVINALSDKYHPTQILADLMTLHEYYYHKKNGVTDSYSAHLQHPKETLPGLKVAWIGDANNMLQEFLVSFPKCGISLAAACPAGYVCDQDVLDIAKADAAKTGASLLFTTDPKEAVKDCDVIITDTWISMGQEAEKIKRLQDFKGFQVTHELAAEGGAKPDWIFMHCLPRKTEEVNDEVFYSDRSVVFAEAENRKWTILSVIDSLMVRGSI